MVLKKKMCFKILYSYHMYGLLLWTGGYTQQTGSGPGNGGYLPGGGGPPPGSGSSSGIPPMVGNSTESGNGYGQNYTCVPIGTCRAATIDIRIVTPDNQLSNPCPPSQEPCYNGGNGNGGGNSCEIGTTQCGRRLLTITNGGDGYSERGAFPWQAFMLNQSGYAGSGVLLDPYHILTAAHKVVPNINNPRTLTVVMGLWDSTDTSQTQSSTVSRIVIHPSYDPDTLKNDIAILRLSKCIVLGQYNTINTGCLPVQNQNFVGQNCIVSGWGQTNFRINDAPTVRQKQVTVPVVHYSTCRQSFVRLTTLGNNVDRYLDLNGDLCAGGQPMKDACTQDGGAPLVCPEANGRFVVAGLVIWGKGCGTGGVYGVYTNVAYYVNWIQNTIATV